MKQKLNDSSEYDWVCKASRKFYGWNSGTGKYIKRKLNKRYRKEGKTYINHEMCTQKEKT